MTNLRNAFIAGAAKSGTTTLYYLLEQHPEVCTPAVKEPNYFSSINNDDPVQPGSGPGDDSTVWINSLKKYQDLYRPTDRHTTKLDASVSYLYSTTAAEQIADYDPDSRIIIVLRNPTERAFSHYKHLLRDGRETVSFEEALEQEQSRIAKGWEFSWHLTEMGMYGEQIQRYLKYFDAEQLHIITLEDLKQDISTVISDITNFLGLSPFEYDLERQERNASGVARSWVLSRIVNWILGYKATINKIIPPKLSHKALQLFRAFNIKKSELEISEDLSRKLKATFKEDIKKTESLIGRRLDGWYNG